MDYSALYARMVAQLIDMEKSDPKYAIWAMNQYRFDQDYPNPNLLRDIKEEKARRASLLRSTNTQPLLPGTTDGDRK